MYMHIQQHMLWHQYALYIFEPNKYYHYSINVVNISMYLTWVSIDKTCVNSSIKLKSSLTINPVYYCKLMKVIIDED